MHHEVVAVGVSWMLARQARLPAQHNVVASAGGHADERAGAGLHHHPRHVPIRIVRIADAAALPAICLRAIAHVGNTLRSVWLQRTMGHTTAEPMLVIAA